MLTLGDPGPGHERCVHCGKLAVGPCARCHAPLCGDCCLLTEGGAKTYAICFACAERHGTNLTRAWWHVIGWFLVPIGALVLALLALHVLFPGR
ncbi:MAG: hypothetical protein JW751_14195 [Polyangiaceae bacterium]|nr:hypothetical protein [Polyangiaceae bacterium]